MNPNDRRAPTETRNRPHIEQPLAINRFSPALRQALMAAEPAFFGWDAQQQDRYRRDMPGEAFELLQRRLGGADTDADSDDWQQINTTNTLKLPLFGIGHDCFYLNEPGSGWYNMETVDDLSREHYEANPDCCPTILEEMAANGSPAPLFETDDDRLTFVIRLPCYPHKSPMECSP